MLNSWYDWVATFTGVAVGTVLLLPVALLVAAALAIRRTVTGTERGWAWRRSLAEVGIVYWTVPCVWMTMMPGSHAGDVPGRYSLIPLKDLLTMGWPGIVGNLLVLAAVGLFAPMRFTALASFPRILAFAAGCSFLIETAQYVLQLDRVSSVDDILINTAGAGLAALASRRWWRVQVGASSDHPRSVPVS